jgi:SAM-dependent methyltransferase
MILDAFRTGGGVAWGEHHPDVFTGCERLYRPGYVANLVSSWIPAVGGLRERLVAGIPVADVGCGLGASTRILADTYPASSVSGFDPPLESIELARKAAAEADLADRCDFTVARAQDFPGSVTGWWQRSTACTTWGTRWVPPATSGRPSPRTASG